MNKINKVKICVVALRFPPDYTGAGLQALRLFNDLKSLNVEWFVISASTNAKFYKESIKGNIIFRIKGNPGNWSTIELLSFWAHLFELLFKTRKNYDIIYVIGANLGLSITGLFAKILSKKLMVKLTLAKSDILGVNKGFWGRFQYFCLKFFDRYISISDEIYQELIEADFDSDKIIKLPNGVKTDIFVPSRKEHSSIQVLYVGMICKRKGSDLLIESWIELLEQESLSATLILVGPVDEHDRVIDNFSHNKTFQKSVKILEPRNDIQKIMKECDIFILPSINEGLPNVVLEAMSCGLPIIGSNTAGITRCVKNDLNGYVINRNNGKNELKEKLHILLKNKTLREDMGKKSREIVNNNFSMKMVRDEYYKIFMTLIGEYKCEKSSL